MKRARVASLFVGAALGAANACNRASEDELLRGKICAADADCLVGFECDLSTGFCARPGLGFSTNTDKHDGGAIQSGTGGSATGDADSGAAPLPSGGGGGSGGRTEDVTHGGGASGSGSSGSGSSGASSSGAGGERNHRR